VSVDKLRPDIVLQEEPLSITQHYWICKNSAGVVAKKFGLCVFAVKELRIKVLDAIKYWDGKNAADKLRCRNNRAKKTRGKQG
jgi:hypothetical protein